VYDARENSPGEGGLKIAHVCIRCQVLFARRPALSS
jgi:hypothetical protein